MADIVNIYNRHAYQHYRKKVWKSNIRNSRNLKITVLLLHLVCMKYIARLLDSLNNNYGNFFRFDQTKRHSLHKVMGFQNVITYFIFFFLICYYERTNRTKFEKIHICQVYLIKLHSILSQIIFISISS